MPATDSAAGGANMSMELVAAIVIAVLAIFMALIDMAVGRREVSREAVPETTSIPVEEQAT